MSNTTTNASDKPSATRQLCDRLRSNDPTLGDSVLCLDGDRYSASSLMRDDDDAWTDFVAALPYAVALRKIQVGERLVRSLSELELARLLLALGRLPCLTHLEVSLWELELNRRKKISAQTLAQFLRAARHLQTLVLWPFLCVQRPLDLEALNRALQGHPNLESFHLLNLLTLQQPTPTPQDNNNRNPPQDNNTNNRLFLDSLLEALATIPNLKHVQLAPGFSVRPSQLDQGFLLSPCSTSLATLLTQAPQLESLALRNAGVTDLHMVAWLDAFSVSLKDKSRGTIQTKRHTLQSLDLRFHPHLTDSVGYRALVDCLTTTQAHVWTHLQHVSLDWNNHDGGGAMELRARLEFQLQLNRVGRHVWETATTTTTREEKFQVLVRCAREPNVDVAFALLQSHPSVLGEIVNVAAATVLPKNHKE